MYNLNFYKTENKRKLTAKFMAGFFLGVFVASYALQPFIFMAGAHSRHESYEYGDKNCQSYGYDFEYKFDPINPGTSTVNLPNIGNINIMVEGNGEYFDWNSDFGIDAVIVKGGNDSELYDFDEEEMGDSGYHSPINNHDDDEDEAEPYGLSYISFCYHMHPTPTPSPSMTPSMTPTPSPTVTPTPTPTPTPSPSATPSPMPTSICHPNPETDLSGSIFNSNRSGKIKNISTNCSYIVGLASYKMFTPNIDDQVLFDSDSNVQVGPGQEITLNVDLPSCGYQADLFYGNLITSFAGGARYGTRILDGKQVFNPPAFCSITTPTPSPSMTPTPSPSMTPSMTPTPSPTVTPTPTPTPTPSPSATPTPTPTATPTPSVTPTPSPSVTPTPTPVVPTATPCNCGGGGGGSGHPAWNYPIYNTPTPTPIVKASVATPTKTPTVLGVATRLPATGFSNFGRISFAVLAAFFMTGIMMIASGHGIVSLRKEYLD